MSSTATIDARRVRLAEVEALVGLWCDQLDPARLTAEQAAEAVERLAGIGRRVNAKVMVLSARVAEGRACPGRSSSPEQYLARVNGTSRSAAKKMLDTAKRLADCPATTAAVDAGVLSIDEADLITAAVVLDPTAEQALVATATSGHDLAEVREAAERVKRAARVGEDPALRRARLRAARRWREWSEDGLVAIDARFVADEWATVRPVLDAFCDTQFHANRKAGIRDRFDGYRADGLIAALATAGAAVGLDLPTLQPAETTAVTADTSPVSADSPTAPTDPPAAPASSATAELDIETSAATADSPSAPHAAQAGLAADTVTAPGSGTTAGVETSMPTAVGSGSSPPGPPGPARPAGPAGSDGEVVDEALATVRTIAGRVPKKVNWNVTVLIDGIALKRGQPSGSEICEIPGIGPVDVDWVHTLLPDAIVDVLVHDLTDIRAYGTLTRHKPRPVKVAVAARDRRCVVPGCRRQRRCQIDHRHDHAKGGPTKTDNVELLCEHHHTQKTHHAARLERTPTEWHWYPPPPNPGEPPPPPDTIPWRARIGEHLPAWDLDHLPSQTLPTHSPLGAGDGAADDTLPFA